MNQKYPVKVQRSSEAAADRIGTRSCVCVAHGKNSRSWSTSPRQSVNHILYSRSELRGHLVVTSCCCWPARRDTPRAVRKACSRLPARTDSRSAASFFFILMFLCVLHACALRRRVHVSATASAPLLRHARSLCHLLSYNIDNKK